MALNEDSAKQGAIALGFYSPSPKCLNKETSESLVDLLTNLMHWAKTESSTLFCEALVSAQAHFEEEK